MSSRDRSATITAASYATGPTPPTTTSTAVPPLPPDVRDLILSHLLPPAPPLPTSLLSRSFIERLTFLPPEAHELDAHLTPAPETGAAPHPLTSALTTLAEAGPRGILHIRDTEYAHDGETMLARTVIEPVDDDQPGFGQPDAESKLRSAVEAMFEHEGGEKGRGWVYRGAKLGDASTYSWAPGIEHVEHVNYSGGDDESPEDYWAGFTPPSHTADLPLHDDEHEDAYWAQYGAGAESRGISRTQTPAPVEFGTTAADHARERETSPDPKEPITPPSATIPTPDPAATLSLLLSGLGGPTADKPPSPTDDILEQKLRATVRAQLMRAWTDFAAGQDAEAAGFEWLRLGREVAHRPSWGNNQSQGTSWGESARTAVVRARLEAAKEVHAVLDTDDKGDAFWRLVEQAIRVHNSPVQEKNEHEFEYEMS